MLYSDISTLIFEMIQSYYNELSGEDIETGLVLSYQTSGDFARWNPHFHGLLLEGGFNEEGRFVYIPICVRIAANDDRARESLAQYIARCPVSSDKIHYEPFHGKVLIFQGKLQGV